MVDSRCPAAYNFVQTKNKMSDTARYETWSSLRDMVDSRCPAWITRHKKKISLRSQRPSSIVVFTVERDYNERYF